MSIEHIVVLMLENRSFDNVLGGLYAPGNAAPYDRPPPGQAALTGIPAGASNPGPNGPVPAHNQTTPTSLGGTGPTYSATAIPLVDPGEYFADIAQQIIPLDAVPTSPVLPPWDGYSPASPHVAQGYVKNYAQLGGMQNLMFKAQKRPPARKLRGRD
jgi:phospholipase C